MKKIIFTLTTILFITSALFTSCITKAKKIENAKENVIDAEIELYEATQDLLVDLENFKKEIEPKISANNLMIADFKAKTAYAKKDAKAYYQEQISILEQKNVSMKIKLDAYEENGKDNWETFKIEFNKDMNDLGKAFKNFTVKNE